MDCLKENNKINQEINRLSLRVALLRYDLREALIKDIPLGFMRATMQEICILQEQKLLLQQGNYKLLPYHIKQLYL